MEGQVHQLWYAEDGICHDMSGRLGERKLRENGS